MKFRPYLAEIRDEIYQGVFEALNREKIKQQEKVFLEINKWYAYNQLMFKWMRIRERKHSIAEYLEMINISRVAIYGIGDIGKLCCDEILQNNINIPYIIDKHVEGDYINIPIISPEKVDNRVDAIIITPICYYLEIAESLYRRTCAKLISLEDIIGVLSEWEER